MIPEPLKPVNVFQFPPDAASYEEVRALIPKVVNYIRAARNPNEADDRGQTLLRIALALCILGEGETLVTDLLRRGANPNKPSALANFTMLISVGTSLKLVEEFVNCGLELNGVSITSKSQGQMTDGPATILDMLYGVREYISPKRKKLEHAVNKYAGGSLGKRRWFIDETIALVESRGGKLAKDL